MYPIMQDLAPLFKKDAENSETNDSSGSNAINSFMQLMEESWRCLCKTSI